MRLLAVLGALAAAVPALADVDLFRMPSGNVECSIGTGEGPSDVRCVIFERTGPPAAPQPAACNGPWGHRFLMRSRGPVQLECGAPGAPVMDGSHDFAYGRTGEVPGISCQSSRQGLECRNADGHGFFLSRARQSVF